MNKKLICNSNRVLRRVLNEGKHEDILKDMVESFFNYDIKEVYINPYLHEEEKQFPLEENFGIADMRITLKDKSVMNIGIQIIDGIYYAVHKMLIYYAKIHTNQLKHKGRTKNEPTRTINILDSNYDEEDSYFKKLDIEINDDVALKEALNIFYVELAKFNKNPKKITDKKEAWIAYLKGYKINLRNPKFNKIAKLDKLLDEYWKSEKMY